VADGQAKHHRDDGGRDQAIAAKGVNDKQFEARYKEGENEGEAGGVARYGKRA